MATTFKKRKVITGLGAGYFQVMETEETITTGPVYDEEVLQTVSLDKVSVELEVSDKKIFASNLLHSNPTGVKLATITLDALYLPEGFEEEVTGMEKLGEGIYAMPTNPVKKYFRFAFPVTNEDGEEIIYNFPKCTLKPLSISGETEREDFNEQVQKYDIVAQPLTYMGATGNIKPAVYYKADMTTTAAREAHDRTKLLENGFYDAVTVAAAKAE